MHKNAIIAPWAFFIPYSVVPLALLFIVVNYIGGWHLQDALPQSAESIFVLGIIFENPHIIASNLMLLDKEYLQFYRWKLFVRVSLVIIFCIILIWTLGARAFYTFFYAWTVYHVARQQIGIGKMLNRAQSRSYTVWGWIFIVVSLAISVGIGYFKAQPAFISTATIKHVIIFGSVGLVISGVALMLILKSSIGRLYLLANIGLIVGTTLCYLQGMPLLAILLPRAVHDITAFIIYTNHDTNRNTPVPRHFLYRSTHGVLPIWLTCIIVAISWAAMVTYSGKAWVIYLVIALTLLHYISEAFTWKTGSLHRQYLKIAL